MGSGLPSDCKSRLSIGTHTTSFRGDLSSPKLFMVTNSHVRPCLSSNSQPRHLTRCGMYAPERNRGLGQFPRLRSLCLAGDLCVT